MQHESARLKSDREPGEQPTSQPMRATRQGEIRRNPSTDQLKDRRRAQRTASGTEQDTYGTEQDTYEPEQIVAALWAQAGITDTRAEMLNPGDMLDTPGGRTMKVTRTRPHETDPFRVYIDTDGGTTLAYRLQQMRIRPQNNQQQSMPGYGTPGGNSNRLPFDPQTNRGHEGNERHGQGNCPICRQGNLVRQGDHYVCNKCGYQATFGGGHGGGFSDSPTRMVSYHTVNGGTPSAIARRARLVLDQKETVL